MPAQPAGTVQLPPNSTGQVLGMLTTVIGAPSTDTGGTKVNVQTVAEVDQDGQLLAPALLSVLNEILVEIRRIREIQLALARSNGVSVAVSDLNTTE